jgi:hypothetical protein
MKRILFALGCLVMLSMMNSCCQCMNCPGYGQSAGTSSDEICQHDYEASGANNSMNWAQYSDYMLQNGCSCIK